jgi:peptide/nickel transport system ATP-binding protein
MTADRPLLSAVEIAAQAQQPLVALTDVSKRYASARGDVLAVDGVSFEIARGEALGLVGESGCGKSTIAKLLVGLEQADTGRITLDGRDRRGLAGAALKAMRRRVQLIFQDPYGALDPRMVIADSLDAPLAAHRIGLAPERRRRIAAMLDAVGLDSRVLARLPRECSGGQLQRVVIARALLLDPEVLICDEPTSALDASVRAQVLNLLVDLRQRFSLTLLMISHDLRVVRYMCERVAVMYLGQIVEQGRASDVFEHSCHPYTKALVAASMIARDGLYHPASQLAGEPGSALNMPSGCRFHPRCRHATVACAQDMPMLSPANRGMVRCHRWHDLTHER